MTAQSQAQSPLLGLSLRKPHDFRKRRQSRVQMVEERGHAILRTDTQPHNPAGHVKKFYLKLVVRISILKQDDN